MAPTEHPVDLAVIGAGPAGLAASVTAADAGLSVLLLDMAERIGGQYWRHLADEAEEDGAGSHHHGWARFVKLRARINAHVRGGRIIHRASQTVWSLERAGSVCVVHAIGGERVRLPYSARARAVIVATGAHDRQLPFPGWTLPGVMAGGGAQSLLKGSGVAPGRRAVVAGTGPFLLPVADTLLAAGVDVVEIVEPNAPWRMLGRPGATVAGVGKLPEAVGYGTRLRRHHVTVSTGHAVIAAHGRERLRSVIVARVDAAWRVVPGSEREVACDLLTVGYGFTPQIELALAAGCATAVGSDGSLVVGTDPAGRTSVSGIYAAGETTGVGGADLALIEGELCGAAVIEDLRRGARGAANRRGRRAPRARRRLLEARRRSLLAFAAGVNGVFSIQPGWEEWLEAETIICRCEEVPYARVRGALDDLGSGDARTVKLLARPGMGLCQGRICGAAVARLAASRRAAAAPAGGGSAELAVGPDPGQEDLIALSRRPLGSPVPLRHLAAFATPTPPATNRGRPDDGAPNPAPGTDAGTVAGTDDRAADRADNRAADRADNRAV